MYDMPNQVGYLCLRPEADDKCLQCFFAPTTTLDNREAVVNRRTSTRMVLSILFLFLTVILNIQILLDNIINHVIIIKVFLMTFFIFAIYSQRNKEDNNELLSMKRNACLLTTKNYLHTKQDNLSKYWRGSIGAKWSSISKNCTRLWYKSAGRRSVNLRLKR